MKGWMDKYNIPNLEGGGEIKPKELYYKYIKPNIDKLATNPIASTLIGGLPGFVASHFYRPDFDARKYKTKDEAYKAARDNGSKTFIWNGNRYNTDYKANPNKSLVEQKQEEIDTYGITNEYTRNRNLFENRLLKNLYPYSYNNPIKRVFNATILNKVDSDKNLIENSDISRRRDDEFGMLLGKPQQNNTFAISKYKPKGSTEDYYFKYKDDNAMIKRFPAEAAEEFFNNMRKNTELFRNDKLKPGEYAYNDSINSKRWEDIRDKFHDIPSNAEYNPIDKTVKATSYSDRENGVMLSYGNIDFKNNANRVIQGSNVGDFTIGKTDDYVSYYDKWDINPFGYGNDKSLYKLGTPLNIYDRKYFDNDNNKKKGKFQYADGGEVTPKKYAQQYVQSPKYKERLSSSGYENVEDEIKERLSKIINTKTYSQYGEPQPNKVLEFEKQGIPYTKGGSSYLPEDNAIITDYKQAEKLGIKPEYITAHEFGHSEVYAPNNPLTEIRESRLNEKDVNDIIQRLSPNSNPTYKKVPDEVKADLNALRYELYNKGIYDAGHEDIDEPTLQRLEDSYIKDRLLKNYKEEDIIWLMNNIAMNNERRLQKLNQFSNFTSPPPSNQWLDKYV